MTDAAYKVLMAIRNGKGWRDLSDYQCRSLPRLINDGYVVEVKCGKCPACLCGCTCETYDIKPAGPLLNVTIRTKT